MMKKVRETAPNYVESWFCFGEASHYERNHTQYGGFFSEI